MKINIGDYGRIYFYTIMLFTETDYTPQGEAETIIEEDKIIAIYFSRETAERALYNYRANEFFTEAELDGTSSYGAILGAELRLCEMFAENDAPAEDYKTLKTRPLNWKIKEFL